MYIHSYEVPVDRKNYDDEVWYVAAFEKSYTHDDLVALRTWCYQTFGETGYNRLTCQTRWRDEIIYGEVYFKNKDDLLMFVLRWS
jgi:hypothetical protein